MNTSFFLSLTMMVFLQVNFSKVALAEENFRQILKCESQLLGEKYEYATIVVEESLDRMFFGRPILVATIGYKKVGQEEESLYRFLRITGLPEYLGVNRYHFYFTGNYHSSAMHPRDFSFVSAPSMKGPARGYLTINYPSFLDGIVFEGPFHCAFSDSIYIYR